MSNLIELQNKIHQQNVEMGWWDNPRPFSTFVCLFHSELSEAMEGDRKGLMDDHLPQYPMFQVELADFVIRCLDWLGSKSHRNLEDNYDFAGINYENFDEIELIARLHNGVSMSYQLYMDKNNIADFDVRDGILSCVEVSIEWCKFKGIDLNQIILEKVEYNKHRSDHKRENREKEGGKKY
ncbi:pyrophosphatase [Vibrio phage Seahorse]|uniref:Nucleoside triphosphate pyrophosphohydrolase n=1 Tax=Vibrio phage Seahorse TaxID=2662136 RepID=A0A6B7SIX2_9CAUD|nr:pyrophosphatase [Vibrio phage Seahorse]QGF21001.1 nucleoside triphosphate pyrophosphohydrolase [Vibrio phage Seahorse]